MSNVNTDLESDLMPLQAFQLEIEKLYKWAHRGCSDGGCQIEVNKGMHTNGGCQCNPRNFAEHLLWLACEVEKYGKWKRWTKTNSSTRNKDLESAGCAVKECSCSRRKSVSGTCKAS